MSISRNKYQLASVVISVVISNPAWSDEVVLIGNVAPTTGSIAHLGKDQENGALMAVEEINSKGLVIQGKKVLLRLDSQDDAGDPRIATQVAQKLVDEHVVAIVGHGTSGTSIPASKIYSDAHIVQISPSATNPTYTQQGFKTTYRVVATDAQQGPALAKYAATTLKLKTVAIVDDATAYGQGLAREFENAAQSLGLKIVSRDATNDKAIDFRAILTKIKGENPDAIMFGGMDATGGAFAKQARQLGMHARVLAGDGVCTEALSELAGPATDNVICSSPGISLGKMSGGAEFAAKYQKRFGIPVVSYAPYSYDAVNVVVKAMKSADSTNPEKILAAMQGTDYKGVTGPIAFDPRGDLLHGVVSIFNYKNGKKTLLDEIRM
ncbi:branched chain amino acid ABC transporter substrate-binding protein (plasmid) [Paraburkholderia caffeinilytica]|uniref:Leucine-, isoleucine-, valine-, threonine-, and alanine-binding protein n=2 Tax=Paraburkholderia TaxID=1822464 RepID=A0A6J5FN25_9BURK|nr:MULTISPECIES: branched-chain amino acid ABC transporter substrate-binding protein [Paraburkholderia]AXL53996.1 branched chain amino acid ABC transporter substrate-binding protein [Paraburkholderia caffeinilytica]GGC65698.1 branched chain amino acid ABC transporter substrate-binding protein [Paraburkholderia caffeinilytica]CAB3781725.1 Leucine-, isoleucine-, valine-, threonine-, and alanine-binding protein [Paraburkholderia caffeinitolerans]CAB3802095.1 Leucine-, isoleucine-, valine-, threoni